VWGRASRPSKPSKARRLITAAQYRVFQTNTRGCR